MSVGVTFAGRDLADVLGVGSEIVVSNVSGRSLIGLEVRSSSSIALDGDSFVSAQLPARDIVVDFSTLGNGTEATARLNDRAVQGWALSREPARLEFTDQPGRWYEAILGGASVRKGGKDWYTGGLTFKCLRPFLYGPTVTEPVSGGTHSAQTNWYVEPVWRIQLATAANGFTLTVDGREYTYTGSLASSSVVTVDTAGRETRVGGQLRVLEAGGTYPTLTASSTVELDVPATVSVAYQPRWA